MNDTGRVLLTAAVLSGITVLTFAWRVSRIDPGEPARLVGELRLAQWAAALLAGVSAVPVGLALANGALPTSGVDAALGLVLVGSVGLILQREPREALGLTAAGFLVHALIDLAHRPGWLSPGLASHGYLAGCAVYNAVLAAALAAVRQRA